jgi:CheY-like chemotaxis protein
VRNLLSFARKPGATLGPVSLSDAMRLAAGLRSSAFAQAGKKLDIDIASSLYVEAETQKLQHVFVNLVNNALDAMTADRGTTLRISASVIDDTVHVCFDDDGPGFVDPRAAFEPFYTTKPAERGTGLGLTISQKFVHEFGGTVITENRAEGGARVTMVLRRAAAPTDEVSASSRQHTSLSQQPTDAKAAATAVAGAERATARPRVLVVDDEPSLRQIQRRLLSSEGVDVLLAANGDEARHILSGDAVDLVISDLRMPGESDGRALIAWITEHRPHLAEQMLIVTGNIDGLPFEIACIIPAERVLPKPFTREEYLARVRTALDRSGLSTSAH